MNKKLILISGSPCVGKTAVGTRLFESYDNSAYLDGDWCWCVHPFSIADSRLRNGDRSMLKPSAPASERSFSLQYRRNRDSLRKR